MHKVLRTVRRGVSAAALVGLTAFTGMAQAVVFVVDWDPLFNPSFSPTVGWEGTAQVTVSPGCLTPSTTTVVGGPCTANLDSATLRFYDPWPSAVPIGTISSWTSGLTAITRVSVDASGIVDGIDLASPLTANTGAIFGSSIYNMEMDFLTPPTAFDPYEGPTLRLVDSGCFEGCEPFFSATSGKNVPSVRWRIPEPGSLALFIVALGALGLSRRRKKG